MIVMMTMTSMMMRMMLMMMGAQWIDTIKWNCQVFPISTRSLHPTGCRSVNNQIIIFQKCLFKLWHPENIPIHSLFFEFLPQNSFFLNKFPNKFVFLEKNFCVGRMAWVREGRNGQSQEARRAPTRSHTEFLFPNITTMYEWPFAPQCSYIGKLNLIKIFHCLSFNFAHKSFCNFTSLLYNCSFVSSDRSFLRFQTSARSINCFFFHPAQCHQLNLGTWPRSTSLSCSHPAEDLS